MSRENVRIRARGLGVELAELRERADLTLREVADRLGWSAPTLCRIENGLRDSTPAEIAALLVVYGVTGAEKERLIELARTINQSDWLEHHGSVGRIPAQLKALVEFESMATRLTDVGRTLVPGLLQTSEYARAVMKSGNVPSDLIEKRINIREARKLVLVRDSPPKLHAILDEEVLRRPLGSLDVMADQLRHLLRATALPNITIQVLQEIEHPALIGPFSILEFEHPGQPYVYLEHYHASSFVDDNETVESYMSARDELAAMAFDESDSREFLARLVTWYEKKLV